MFSIALVTIKFFPDFKPKTGFSLTSGTLGFLKELSYEKLRTLLNTQYLEEEFSFPLFPYASSENYQEQAFCHLLDDLRFWCLRTQCVPAVQRWIPRRGWSSLYFSKSTSGLEVVWWQKVVPVGLTVGGNLDLYNGSLGAGTYYLGMIL